jgi:Coenzyme PQQ synthesis protein D (PqqD)
MKISTADVVVRDDEPIAASVDGETVILSAKAEGYFGLGEVGSDIWQRLATPRRVSDICAELVEAYDVEPEICERDTLAFLTKLLEDRLIRIVHDDPSSS